MVKRGEAHRFKLKLRAVEEDNERLRSKLGSGAELALNMANDDKASERSANDIVKDWIDYEGDYISHLLLRRAVWTHKHAAGYLRPMGLLAAKAYATAAVVLWPQNSEAITARDQLASYFKNEVGTCSIPLSKALIEFDEKAEHFFEFDPNAGNVGYAEAERRLHDGRFDLALPMVELALSLYIKSLGEKSLETLRAKRLKAYIIDGQGHPEKALPIAEAVYSAFTTDPAFDPHQADALASGYLVANLLFDLRRNEEALKLAQDVESDMKVHLPPLHYDDLVAGGLVARCLSGLRRYNEALEKAQSVRDAMLSRLGPSHRETLAVRELISIILCWLGRRDEGLKEAKDTASATADRLGADHPVTLQCGLNVAGIFYELGRNDEALTFAKRIRLAQINNHALGASHPDTVKTERLIAAILLARK